MFSTSTKLAGVTLFLSGLPLLAQAVTDCSPPAQTQIPQAECEALVDLYNSTDGPNWINNTDWNVTNTPCSWGNVTCDGGHVVQLNLYYNQLVGSLPDSLGSLSSLTHLNLHHNQLTGSLPNSLGRLSHLQMLSLSVNQFTGSLPDSLGELKNLQRMSLIDNQLSGPIPQSLGNLNNLENLFLRHNQLSGSIPESLGDLSNLDYLDLSNNQLSGSIPDSLANLNDAGFIQLNNNHLCGDIPLSLMSMDDLVYLELYDNHLTAPSDPPLIEWLNDKSPGWESQTVSPEYCRANLVRLDSFMATLNNKNVTLAWATGTEQDNAGFCLWRSVVDGNGQYTDIIKFAELNPHQKNCVEGQLIAVEESDQLITAVGTSREGACYSFEDTSINEDGTYVYVLEDVDTSGKRTFHCNNMDAVTVGQGPTIDWQAAKRFCRQATGSVE